MKPDADSMEADIEVDPVDLFCQLGYLVLESRVPEVSPKGRRDGPHCPLGPGELPLHSCDPDTIYKCKRARSVQRQMNLLWKNRVPMCIEVLLYQDCNHGQQAVIATDLGTAPAATDGSCVLLERWLILAQPHRSMEGTVSPRALFQAMRSYLHFSQLSAWFNRTQGQEPANIGYRVSPPGDFCTTKFQCVPEWHTFPVCYASKYVSLKVTLGALPRLPYIPVPLCRESVGDTDAKQAVTDEKRDSAKPLRCQSPAFLSVSPQEKYPCGRKTPESHSPEHSSPHSIKKAASEHIPSAECEKTWSYKSRGSPDPLHVKSPAQQRSPSPQCSPKILKGFSPPPSSEKDPAGSRYSPTIFENVSRETGAIPKRPMHTYGAQAPHKSQPDFSDHHALSAPELESLPDQPSHPSEKSPDHSSMSTSPKVIITQKNSGLMHYMKDAPSAWAVIGRESTDSGENSSPELDKFLSKTLMGKKSLEPLSPQEMDHYLATLSTNTLGINLKNSSSSITDLKMFLSKKASDKKQIDCLKHPMLSYCSSHICPESKNLRTDYDNIKSSKNHLKLDFDQEEPMKSQEQSNQTGPTLVKDIASTCSQKPSDTEPTKDICDDKPQLKSSKRNNKQTDDTSERIKFTLGDDAYENDSTARPSVVEQTDLSTPHSTDNISKHYEPYIGNNTAVKPQLRKSVSYPRQQHTAVHDQPCPAVKHANSLLKAVIKKEPVNTAPVSPNKNVPSVDERSKFHMNCSRSSQILFHKATGLPLQSSPAPLKKKSCSTFDYDNSLINARAIKNSISCVNLEKEGGDNENEKSRHLYSASAPASTNCLLGNFEESLLNGRIEPSGVVEGFTADIGASGAFCPRHLTLPVTAFFFKLSDDNAPSPYLGHINLEGQCRRGYHVPKEGTVQVTLFNPNKAVVKMFVVVYKLRDMPANSTTFLRQRTLYMPVGGGPSDQPGALVYLRYLIHLRFASSKSGKIYLHTDIRLIFAQDKLEFDSRVANYELRSFTEGPTNPTFSPKR